MGTSIRAWGVAAFTALSVGVGINMMMMQSPAKQARARTAQAQGPVIGQTMMIEAPVKVTRPSGAMGKSRTGADAGKPAALRPAGADPVPGAANSEIVKAIQRELVQRGYEAGADEGVLNIISRAAIMAYEHDQGLRLTAEPSDELLKMLVLGPGDGPRPAPKAAAHGQEQRPQVDQIIRTVQQSLGAIGYHPARADGRLSLETERAIREFEMDQGLAPTGRISGTLMQRLARVAANGKLSSGR